MIARVPGMIDAAIDKLNEVVHGTFAYILRVFLCGSQDGLWSKSVCNSGWDAEPWSQALHRYLCKHSRPSHSTDHKCNNISPSCRILNAKGLVIKDEEGKVA